MNDLESDSEVIEGHRLWYQSKARIFLLVNTTWTGGAEIASTGKCKYGKCKYETGHFARMENASTENVSTPVNTNCGVRLNFTK